jgi:hypothetical protein
MKVKKVESFRMFYMTVETEQGNVRYKTDWTRVWQVMKNDGTWEKVNENTQELQKLLDDYFLNNSNCVDSYFLIDDEE